MTDQPEDIVLPCGDAACSHTDEEIREMAHQVWLKDQTKLFERALSKEALDAFSKEER